MLSACGASAPPPGETCTPGQNRCSSNAYETCADDGARWVQVADCAASQQICVVNSGCLVCVPDTTRCGGDGFDVMRCRPDGSAEDPLLRCDPEIGDICSGAMCVNACSLSADSRSYEGCDYWAVDLDNAVVSDQGTAAAQQYSIVVTNPLELPATVTVTVNDAPPGMPADERVVDTIQLSRIVGGGDLAIIDLDAREVDCSSDPRLNDGSGTCYSSNAFHIVSTAPIVAYQFNPLENVDVFSNDASLLLPTKALEKDYLVMGWPQTLASTDNQFTNGGIDLRAFITIVGTEAETTVTVRMNLWDPGDPKESEPYPPSAPTLGATGIPPMYDGDVEQIPKNSSGLPIKIGKYDVLNIETDDFNSDFTGTLIQADKPIAVFSGSEASDSPRFLSLLERQCCADHLEEQLFPIAAFGTRFVAVKTPLRTKYVEEGGWDVALVPDEPEFWRILASVEDTRVFTNLPPPNDNFSLQSGEYVTFSTERDFVLSSDSPISFAQIPGSQDTTGIPPVLGGGVRPPGGDPSLILIPPVEQWRSKYVFLVPNKYAFDFLLLAVPTGTDILYDGSPLATVNNRCEYEPIGQLDVGGSSTEYQAVRCPLSAPTIADPGNPANQDDGRHVLESTDGSAFGLIVWGWDSYVSYGYPGGTNLSLINPL